MNEPLKQKVERAIGDEFVEWLNQTTGSDFQFDRIGVDPPDLIYRNGDTVMPVEVTTSYYNEEDATMLWKHARRDPAAPTKWKKPLDEPDQRLIAGINKRIAEKSSGAHDAGTVLVIEVYAGITTKSDFERVKSGIAVARAIPFAAIYVTGTFGSSRDGPAGYFCWKVS